MLGAGTTVIPDDTGDLGQYMASLRRLLELEPDLIYPAHGPVIRDAQGKIREYIAHRELREQQVIEALREGPLQVMAIVKKIYTDVPEFLHDAAASSVRSQFEEALARPRCSCRHRCLGSAWRHRPAAVVAAPAVP